MKQTKAVTLVWIVVAAAIAGSTTTVMAGAPAIAVTDATLSTAEATVGEPVTVTATVENTGETNGTAALELTANGTSVANRSVTVPAGESLTVEFAPAFDDPGSYDLAVNGVPAGTLSVTEDPTLIEECTTITDPGYYRLGADLTAPGDAEACITIAASDVVLDGQGHVLDGTSGYDSEPKTVHYGVAVSAPDDAVLSNVTVRNLVVTEWTHGVDFDGVADASVVEVTARHNRVGVSLRATDGATLQGGQYVDAAKHGVRVRGHSTDVQITGATVADNGDRGVFVSRSDGTLIAGNAVTDNAAGVFVQDTRDTVVRGNELRGNAETGVLGRVTNGTQVLDNEISSSDVGVRIQAAHGEGHGSDGHDDGHDDTSGEECTGNIVPGPSRVAGNTVTDAGTVGISIAGVSGSTVVDNDLANSGTWALRTENGAADTDVSGLSMDDRVAASFTGTDVAVRGTDVPGPTPAGHQGIDAAVEVVGTSANATWNGLALGYDQGAVENASVDESTLHLWRHDGSTWSLLATPSDWRYDATLAAWVATTTGTSVDAETNVVSADAREFGVYAPLAGPITTGNVTVTGATVAPETVDDGEPFTVNATVAYDGSAETTAVVDLVVDGTVVDSQVVTLPPGETTPVTFTHSLGPGEYDVAVSGVPAGNVTVLDVTPPTADAGQNVVVTHGTPVDFDASGSSDDVGIASHEWTLGDGTSANGERVSHVYPGPGQYTATLTATDAAGNAATDTVTVTVEDRTPPTADAGPDRTVTVGSRVPLDGSGSHDLVGIWGYEWHFDDDTSATGKTTSHVYEAVGTYTVELIVTDTSGNAATDTATIVVEDRTPPTAAAGPDRSVAVGNAVQFDAGASSDNGEIVEYEWAFGDGTTASGEVVTHAYAAPGTYTATLTVTDSAGNAATDAVTVTAEDRTPPTAAAGPDRTVAAGSTVRLDASGSTDDVGVDGFEWTLPDGTTASGATTTVAFDAPGTYTVELTVTDAAGNAGTDAVAIGVEDRAPPTADAGPNRTVGIGSTVSLDASGSTDDVGIADYRWTFPDGHTESGETGTAAFDAPGTYTVELTVTDGAGNVATDAVGITVEDWTPPTADAGGFRTVTAGTRIAFDAGGSTDNLGVVDYEWAFGDGTTATGETARNTFPSPGTYTVTLTVADAAGNVATDTVNVDVRASSTTADDASVPAGGAAPPTAAAGPDRTVAVGSQVTFDASGSSDDVRIAGIEWAFGDGTTASGEVAIHAYAAPGTYTATLTVTDSAGNAATDAVTVTAEDRTPPTAAAGPDRTVAAGSTVRLDASGSTDDVGVDGFEWTLPDGTTASGATTTVAFDAPGTYEVELRVGDGAGHAATDSVTVVVEDRTSPDAVVEVPSTAAVGETVALDASGSTDDVGVVDYRWTLPDGHTERGETVTATFDEPGTHEVTLVVSDAAGNTARTTAEVTVETTGTTTTPETPTVPPDDVTPAADRPDDGVDPFGVALVGLVVLLLLGSAVILRLRR